MTTDPQARDPLAATHKHHPGHCASECPHRIVVNIGTRPSAATSNGYACAVTGGHCHPGSITECQEPSDAQ